MIGETTLETPSSDIHRQLLTLQDPYTMESYCQAYLITPDLALTARHCIRTGMIIQNIDTLFVWSGYDHIADDVAAIQVATHTDVVTSQTQIANFVAGDVHIISKGVGGLNITTASGGHIGPSIVIDTVVSPGQSGSPVFDVGGQLVGIVSSTDYTNHKTIAIPAILSHTISEGYTVK